MSQAHELAHQQRRTHAKRAGERDFGDDQRVAETPGRDTHRGATTGILQSGVRIGTRRHQRRREANQHRGDEAGSQKKKKHPPVEPHLVGAR